MYSQLWLVVLARTFIWAGVAEVDEETTLRFLRYNLYINRN